MLSPILKARSPSLSLCGCRFGKSPFRLAKRECSSGISFRKEGALAAVAKTLEVKSSSYLKVLNALGSECIGALVLESADEREDDPYGYDPLSREELGRAFEAGAEGVVKLQEEAKLSLAGVQSKMGLYVDRSSGSLRSIFYRRELPPRRTS